MPKTPHIMVDAFPMVDDHYSGIGHYTTGIATALDELAGEEKLTYSLIVPSKWAQRIHGYNLQNYRKVIKNPVPHRIIRGLIKYNINFPLDIFLGRGRYYFPSYISWPLWFNESVVVIHDVTYLAVPECVAEPNRKYLE